MPIEYRTSDLISIEEIDPRIVPHEGQELRGVLVADYLRYMVTDPDTSKQRSSERDFGVYLIRQPKTNFIVLGSYNVDPAKRHGMAYLRAFQVGDEMVESVIHQLSNNRGVLDSELDRVRAVTHGFSYSVLLDTQQQKLYDSESSLPRSWMNHRHHSKFMPFELNKRAGMRSTDMGYCMTQAETVEFGESVFEEYGITNIRFKSDMMVRYSALCRIIGSKRRVNMFEQTSPAEIAFNVNLPIYRGVVLHEIAHALDLREFGGFSHGPTFVLIYAELLAKFCNLNFAHTLRHFSDAGLLVANPVLSDQFETLSRTARRHYIKQHRLIANSG